MQVLRKCALIAILAMVHCTIHLCSGSSTLTLDMSTSCGRSVYYDVLANYDSSTKPRMTFVLDNCYSTNVTKLRFTTTDVSVVVANMTIQLRNCSALQVSIDEVLSTSGLTLIVENTVLSSEGVLLSGNESYVPTHTGLHATLSNLTWDPNVTSGESALKYGFRFSHCAVISASVLITNSVVRVHGFNDNFLFAAVFISAATLQDVMFSLSNSSFSGNNGVCVVNSQLSLVRFLTSFLSIAASQAPWYISKSSLVNNSKILVVSQSSLQYDWFDNNIQHFTALVFVTGCIFGSGFSMVLSDTVLGTISDATSLASSYFGLYFTNVSMTSGDVTILNCDNVSSSQVFIFLSRVALVGVNVTLSGSDAVVGSLLSAGRASSFTECTVTIVNSTVVLTSWDQPSGIDLYNVSLSSTALLVSGSTVSAQNLTAMSFCFVFGRINGSALSVTVADGSSIRLDFPIFIQDSQFNELNKPLVLVAGSTTILVANIYGCFIDRSNISFNISISSPTAVAVIGGAKVSATLTSLYFKAAALVYPPDAAVGIVPGPIMVQVSYSTLQSANDNAIRFNAFQLYPGRYPLTSMFSTPCMLYVQGSLLQAAMAGASFETSNQLVQFGFIVQSATFASYHDESGSSAIRIMNWTFASPGSDDQQHSPHLFIQNGTTLATNVGIGVFNASFTSLTVHVYQALFRQTAVLITNGSLLGTAVLFNNVSLSTSNVSLYACSFRTKRVVFLAAMSRIAATTEILFAGDSGVETTFNVTENVALLTSTTVTDRSSVVFRDGSTTVDSVTIRSGVTPHRFMINGSVIEDGSSVVIRSIHSLSAALSAYFAVLNGTVVGTGGEIVLDNVDHVSVVSSGLSVSSMSIGTLLLLNATIRGQVSMLQTTSRASILLTSAVLMSSFVCVDGLLGSGSRLQVTGTVVNMTFSNTAFEEQGTSVVEVRGVPSPIQFARNASIVVLDNVRLQDGALATVLLQNCSGLLFVKVTNVGMSGLLQLTLDRVIRTFPSALFTVSKSSSIPLFVDVSFKQGASTATSRLELSLQRSVLIFNVPTSSSNVKQAVSRFSLTDAPSSVVMTIDNCTFAGYGNLTTVTASPPLPGSSSTSSSSVVAVLLCSLWDLSWMSKFNVGPGVTSVKVMPASRVEPFAAQCFPVTDTLSLPLPLTVTIEQTVTVPLTESHTPVLTDSRTTPFTHTISIPVPIVPEVTIVEAAAAGVASLAVVASAPAAVVGAAAFDSLQLAAVGQIMCAKNLSMSRASATSILRLTMSPFFDLGPLWIVVGNIAIVAVSGFFQFVFSRWLLPALRPNRWVASNPLLYDDLVVPLGDDGIGDRTPGCVTARFPSYTNVFHVWLSGGITFASVRLISEAVGDPTTVEDISPGVGYSIGLLGLLYTAGSAVAQWKIVTYRVLPAVRQSMWLDQGFLAQTLMPKFMWHPKAMRRCFGSMYSSMKVETVRLQLVPQVQSMVFTAIAAVHVPTKLCWAQYTTMMALAMALIVLLVWQRPFRAPMITPLTVLSTLLLFAMMTMSLVVVATTGTSLELSDAGLDSLNKAIAAVSLMQSIVTVIKTIYSIAVLIYEKRRGKEAKRHADAAKAKAALFGKESALWLTECEEADRLAYQSAKREMAYVSRLTRPKSLLVNSEAMIACRSARGSRGAVGGREDPFLRLLDEVQSLEEAAAEITMHRRGLSKGVKTEKGTGDCDDVLAAYDKLCADDAPTGTDPSSTTEEESLMNLMDLAAPASHRRLWCALLPPSITGVEGADCSGDAVSTEQRRHLALRRLLELACLCQRRESKERII